MRITSVILTWIAAMFGWHILTLAVMPATATAEETPIGRFSAGDLAGWQKTVFAGETVYRLERPSPGEDLALHAESHASASGYCRDVSIDLRVTPMVDWSWRMDIGPENLAGKFDERQKSGDDHPLRLYFVHRAGLFGLSSVAMEYVWSMTEPVGAHWPNPYAHEVMQLAVDSGTQASGSMQHHSRDLFDDFRRLVGVHIDRIDKVCLMTDSDQSKLVSKGWYGDIGFSNKP